MEARGSVTMWVLGVSLAFLAGCVTIQRTPSQPDLYAQIDEACRIQAEYYNDAAPVYAQCMKKRGYKSVTEADY